MVFIRGKANEYLLFVCLFLPANNIKFESILGRQKKPE